MSWHLPNPFEQATGPGPVADESGFPGLNVDWLAPTPKPDLQRSGGVQHRLRLNLVLPFRGELPLTPALAEQLRAAVTTRVECLGAQELDLEVVASHVRLELLLPPALSVERLVVWLQRELAATWAIITGQLLPFAGGYMADTCDPELPEIQGFLDNVRPGPSLI